MNKIVCPYCGQWQDAEEESYHVDTMKEHDCTRCGKTFGYYVEWRPDFREFELPCRNGEEHQWLESICHEGTYRCQVCGDTKEEKA